MTATLAAGLLGEGVGVALDDVHLPGFVAEVVRTACDDIRAHVEKLINDFTSGPAQP
ncbi:hypothetical protein HC031_09330 [Planosporangium thailandense]|uniref:Uncharacterized protein n=1 Tax=Planosporangium thailandense TaxID=765197 RepID=A0ABX0XV72_9ACTN|nr:hypothetical protein [Planosporangium thailandense]NJC69915.1 hypothetical protein [Planosporangium thailandense]